MINSTDVFVIGGGINGVGIAAEASLRGLSVTLCDKNDLASGTSSASTKLIHGGLRYLEQYEFQLVWKALRERERLIKIAGHLIHPQKFVMPNSTARPSWFIRMGLYVYDALSFPSSLPYSTIDKNCNDILKDNYRTKFSFYDCRTDDARLVIHNALLAQQHGANILPRVEFLDAKFENNHWTIHLKNNVTNESIKYISKFLVNASGPWITQINNMIQPCQTIDIQLVKGSHIVTSQLYTSDEAYLLQNTDKRVVFVIPFQKNFTLIGTTDTVVDNALDTLQINPDESAYLIETVNKFFKKNISDKDIKWSYAGARTLQNENKAKLSEVTRDYKFIFNSDSALATIISGKLTTYRTLSVEYGCQLPIFKT